MNASSTWRWCLMAAIAGAGCGQAPETSLTDAHALPSHHPRTFHRAVVVLGGDGLTPAERRDVIRWLPELAADTPLGRKQWERVVTMAAALATASPRSPAADDPLAALRAIDAELPPEDRRDDELTTSPDPQDDRKRGIAP